MRQLNARFLLDTGADSSVLSADVLTGLKIAQEPATTQIAGVGGTTDAVLINTTLRFFTSDRAKVTFKGIFRAVNDISVLDMSVLGRDITDWFAVIVDRPQDVVCLVSQGHGYTVHAKN